jgi:hypothetical protein
MAAEAARLKHQVDGAMNDIVRRLFNGVGPDTLQLANFAMIDVPLAAVRRHVANHEMPPVSVEDLIARTYAALIAPARKHGPGTTSARRSSQ